MKTLSKMRGCLIIQLRIEARNAISIVVCLNFYKAFFRIKKKDVERLEAMGAKKIQKCGFIK